jgi:5-formyltetrahydrofolate cyclo-ligase
MGDQPQRLIDKAELRAIMRARRAAMTPAEVAEQSAQIHARLDAWPVYTDAPAIATYIEKGNEVQTRPLIQRALTQNREVYAPVLTGAPQPTAAHMHWSRLTSLAHLAPGPFGVPQPAEQHRHLTDPPYDSIVLVPGLAFTPQGHRLGYGGGHFDRFLATFTGTPIALAYNFQLLDTLPTEPHDIPVHHIVTPTAIHSCH